MEETFLKKHENKINELTEKFCEILEHQGLNINTKDISMGKCIAILSELNKLIMSMVEIQNELKEIDPNIKIGILFKLVINILNSDKIKSKLSPNVHSKIIEFSNNMETLNAITDALVWINEVVLESHDNNNDGIVTHDEIVDDCVDCFTCKKCGCTNVGKCCNPTNGCCKVCFPIGKSMGKMWSCILLKILCCTCANQIEIKPNDNIDNIDNETKTNK